VKLKHCQQLFTKLWFTLEWQRSLGNES